MNQLEFSVILSLILMLGLAFAIGTNDETLAPLVGTRVIKLNILLVIGAGLMFLGVLFLSQRTGKTIGSNLLGSTVEYTVPMMPAIIISTSVWLITASRIGTPVSTTHTVVGSVFGIALSLWIQGQVRFVSALNWLKLGEVMLGWLISPLIGYFGAMGIQLVISKLITRKMKGLEQLENLERFYLILLIIAVAFTQLSRGGNDSANALGILYGLIESGDVPEKMQGFWVILAGIMLSGGLILVGRIVIKNVGQNLIELRPSDAFTVQISTGLLIFMATMLGLPTSGTQILIFSMIGAGRVKGEAPDKKALRTMILSWLLTLPIAAFLSCMFFLIFSLFM